MFYMNDALIDKNRLEGLAVIVFLSGCLTFRFRIGDIGMGYLLTCFMMYEAMWVFFGDKISEVVGRLLRSKYSKNKFKSAKLVMKYSASMNYFTAFVISLVIGFVGSYILLNVFKISHAYYLIWLFAVLFVLRLINENIAAYLCSRKNSMTAVGAVSVIRFILFAAFGNISITILADYGEKVSKLLKQDDFSAVYSCIGICLSAILSEILVMILLLVLKLVAKQSGNDYEEDFVARRDNTGNVFLLVWKRRILDAIGGLFVIFPFVAGVFLIYHHIGNAMVGAEKIGLFGVTVLIPALIFVSFGYIMLLPLTLEITSDYRKDKMRYAQNAFQTGFHLCFIYGAFGCMYLIAESSIIATLFEGEAKELASKLLVYGGFSTLFMLASLFMLRLLVMNGLTILTYFVQIPADVVFVLIMFFSMKKASDVTIAFSLALMIQFIIKFIGYLLLAVVKMEMNIDPISNVLVPVLVAAVVCVLNVLISKVVSPHLGNIFTLLISFVEMVILYLIILLLSRNFKETELNYLPASKFVMSLGQTLHVL